MEKCETCKHWRRGASWYETPKSFGGCYSPKIKKHFAFPKEWDEFSSDEAIVEFDEEWGIIAGEQFGCIHHEIQD